ncbi:hypothetical protein [Streptomyces sp. NPDC050485]|uniref:hypothetical protein n=1 Tax=Streptomyces sp. NPDC050485 TaxID=3365617 RepID=UPI0037A28415
MFHIKRVGAEQAAARRVPAPLLKDIVFVLTESQGLRCVRPASPDRPLTRQPIGGPRSFVSGRERRPGGIAVKGRCAGGAWAVEAED